MFYMTKKILIAIYNQSIFLSLSFLILPFAIFYRLFILKNAVWLVGENDGKPLYDNGYVFYKYCREIYPDRLIYFIVKNNKNLIPDQFLAFDANTVKFGSFKHVFLFLISNTLVYSHAQGDVAYIQLIKLFKKKCTKVFLQHGIVAFKQVHATYRKNHNEMDIFIVTSDFEKQIIENNFDLNNNVLRVTGLARYDTLFNSSGARKSILYMPTWRNWAVTRQSAEGYILGIEKLLNDPTLNKLLSNHDVDFKFYIHDKMTPYLSQINIGKKIEVIHSSKSNLQDILKESSLLITDYSSVAWDFFYLKKPVLFYQFDQKEYLRKQGAYLNFDNELFGEVFTNSELLTESIEKYLTNNFAELTQYAEKRKSHFKYQDKNNCQRIFNTIISYNEKWSRN